MLAVDLTNDLRHVAVVQTRQASEISHEYRISYRNVKMVSIVETIIASSVNFGLVRDGDWVAIIKE